MCHGAAGTVATAAPVTVAPALLPFALPLVVPVSSSCVPLSPEPRHLLPRLWWPPRHVCVCGKQQECLCPDMCVCDVDATAATRQPPAATKKDATASGADAAACAAAATHPVSLHCTELPPLPPSLPSLLSLSLSALAQTSHAVLCSARWGSCCRALSLFICQMSSSSCRSASFSNFCAKRFSFTVAVVLSCVTRRGRQSRGMPSDYLFSHVLPHSDHGFSMAPPSWKQMERKRSSEKDRSL